MKYELPQPFEELDHTADIGVVVRGDSAEECLARLVLALSHILTGGGAVTARTSATIDVEPSDHVNMAIDVLRELLFRFDTERVIAASCSVVHMSVESGTRVVVDLAPHDERAHEEGTDLKAVTLHEARFERDERSWLAQIVFDV